MARKVETTLVDDMTGDAADDETVSFGLDGVEFEIDLSANNAGVLRDILADYANAGRKVGKRTAVSNGRSRPSATPRQNREQTAAIRAWAREAGRQVSDRGRISAEVAKAFEDAHPGLAPWGDGRVRHGAPDRRCISARGGDSRISPPLAE